jgi:hypothetical protein
MQVFGPGYGGPRCTRQRKTARNGQADAWPLRVTDAHMNAAPDQLLDTRSELTRALLGGGPREGAPAPAKPDRRRPADPGQARSAKRTPPATSSRDTTSKASNNP